MVYVRVLCGVRYVFMGLGQEEDITQPMERMTSSGDCHRLPKWGRLKGHAVPPCVVLVIDDILYGLMVALSYI